MILQRDLIGILKIKVLIKSSLLIALNNIIEKYYNILFKQLQYLLFKLKLPIFLSLMLILITIKILKTN